MLTGATIFGLRDSGASLLNALVADRTGLFCAPAYAGEQLSRQFFGSICQWESYKTLAPKARDTGHWMNWRALFCQYYQSE